MSSALELQVSAWDAEARHDYDGVLEHFHPEATVKSSRGDEKRGHAAIRAMTEEFCLEFPGLEIGALRDFGNGETSAAIEFLATVTDTAGARSVIHGVYLVEIEGGKFTTVRIYEEEPVPIGGSDHG